MKKDNIKTQSTCNFLQHLWVQRPDQIRREKGFGENIMLFGLHLVKQFSRLDRVKRRRVASAPRVAFDADRVWFW